MTKASSTTSHSPTGGKSPVDAVFARVPFEQQSAVATEIGCALTPEGYVEVDDFQRTSVPGVYGGRGLRQHVPLRRDGPSPLATRRAPSSTGS